MKKLVCVVGQGYVGLPLAHAASLAGHNVIGLEKDRAKVELLLVKHQSYIDDVSNTDIAQMHRNGYKAVTSPLYFMDQDLPDVWVITVPTPLKDGKPDLTYVRQAALGIGAYVKPGALVILESTVAPGTTRGEFAEALRQGRMDPEFVPGKDYHLAFSPERIDPGNSEFNFYNTTKLVAGYTTACREKAFSFYASILASPLLVHPVQTLEVAETAKLLENTFRHVNIALVNELARHCNDIGVNVWDVVNAAATKPYGFMKFTPGPGVGGHCLPVDPAYLSDMVKTSTGNDFHFVNLAMRINDSQPAYVVQRVMELLNEESKPVRDSKILLMGFAYKPDTADARESPAMHIRESLENLGAEVVVYDPHVQSPSIVAKLPDSKDFDAVVLLTDHTEFRDRLTYDEVDSWDVPILDTRDAFEPTAANVTKL